jgi:hypothetical protein
VSNPTQAFAILNVQVRLSRVCDLTASPAQTLLQTDAQALTGDWDGWHMRSVIPGAVPGPTGVAPTQELGQRLSRNGVEGCLAISARVPTHRNRVIFPGNLDPESFVHFRDHTGQVVHSIR